MTMLSTGAQAQISPSGDPHSDYFWFRGNAGLTINNFNTSVPYIELWEDQVNGQQATFFNYRYPRLLEDESTNYNPVVNSPNFGALRVDEVNKALDIGGSIFLVVTQYNKPGSFGASPLSTLDQADRSNVQAGNIGFFRSQGVRARYAGLTVFNVPDAVPPYPADVFDLDRPHVIELTVNNVHLIHRRDGVDVERFLAGSNQIVISDINIHLGNSDTQSGLAPVWWPGYTGELIMFFDPVTDNQRDRIISYLALKYGITLAQNPTRNYIASDNTTLMWDASKAGIYNKNIAGLGRDDATGLSQVGKSTSTGPSSMVTMLGLNEGFNTSPLFDDIDNLEFLTWGNDGSGLTEQTTEMPSGLNGFAKRTTREWKVQETGELGTLRMFAHVSRIAGLGASTVDDFKLLIDPDGDFSDGNATVYPATSYDNISATFDQNINLNDGQYFTFITEVAPLTVQFTQDSAAVAEGVGNQLPQLQVQGRVSTLNNEVEIELLATSPNPATTGTDYIPDLTTPLTVIIPPGDYLTPQIIPIPGLAILDDNVLENNETFKLAIIDDPNNDDVVAGTQSTTAYTILNDDTLTVAFNQPTGSDSENIGANLPQLTVQGDVTTAAYTVEVVLNNPPGNATPGGDYNPDFSTPITVTLPAGDYSTAQNIPIPGLNIVDDNLLEDDETLNLILQNPSPQLTLGVQRTTTYTIVDNETLTVAFDQPTGSDNENVGGDLPQLNLQGAVTTSSYTVEVALDNPSGNTTPGTDYNPDFTNPITVTLPAGDYTTAQNIPISGLNIIDDNLLEDDETLNLILQNPSPELTLGTQQTTSYTIIDNETLTVAFNQPTGSDSENVGANLPQLTLQGAVTTSSYTVEVALDNPSGNATPGSDYNPDFTAPITVTLPAGDYTTAQNIPIPGLNIIDDNLLEDDETLNLIIQNPSSEVTLGVQRTTTYTIVDDEGIIVVFNQPTGSDSEASGANLPQLAVSGGITPAAYTIEVALDNPSGNATPGTDYNPDFTNPIIVTIPAGDYTTSQNIPIPGLNIIDDNLLEDDETLNLVLQNQSPELTLGVQRTTTYTIVDDEALIVEFSQAVGAGNEDVGDNLPQLVVTGAAANTAYSVEIILDNPAGTATPGDDYSPNFNTPITVTIPAGDYTTSQNIPIPGLSIIDDTPKEENETLRLILQNPSNALTLGTLSQTEYTIVDDDPDPLVTLATNANQINENGGQAILTVELSHPSFEDIIIELDVVDSIQSGRYTISQTRVVIPAGSLSANVEINANDDNIYQGNEDIEIAIGQVVNGTEDGDQRVVINMQDDEMPPLVTLSIDKPTITENSEVATVTLLASGIANKDITVELRLGGTATGNGLDYQLSGQQAVIPAGQVETQITITSTPDELSENEETVIVEISNVVNGAAGAPSLVQTTIDDNSELPVLSIQSSETSIEEPGGEAILTIELSQPSARDVTFELVVSGQVDSQDYTLENTSFTIPAGQRSVSTRFIGQDDLLQENREIAYIQLNAINNAQAHPTQYIVEIAILDDDALVINEGFSPNGDGVADIWYIKNIEKYPNNSVRIFNRWGNLVYETKGYNNADKSFEGRANVGLVIGQSALPDGTYFYKIDLGQGESKPRSGFIAMYR